MARRQRFWNAMGNVAGRILLGDIGGTNARFALYEGESVGPIETLQVADYETVEAAIHDFVVRHPGRNPVQGAVLAGAGPVNDGRCRLTNSTWVIDAAELSMAFGWRRVRVINDFEAIAWSLPCLAPKDLFPIGAGRAAEGAPAAALGPGTGLGVAYVLPETGGWRVIGTEGGHATLAGTSAKEDVVIARLRERFHRASAERALSGGGLVNLYEAIAAIDGKTPSKREAAEIAGAAIDGTCPISRQALDMFCAMLGSFAGNVALTVGARGGIFLSGGIVPRILDYLGQSEFRARFEAGGRLKAYLSAIPTSVITHPDPAFVGLEFLLEHVFTDRFQLRLEKA
jgi:glucokinase